MRTTDFAAHLSYFINNHLAGQKNLSSNTIASYCTTFKLLLIYIAETYSIHADNLQISNISSEMVDNFLIWLRTERNNSISTTNQRLAAIHAFCKYLMYEKPEELLRCQQILAIPFKKQRKPIVQHFSKEALKILLNQPNPNTKYGFRDMVLLSTMYDTGARVQEIINLKVSDIRIERPAIITLTGKGNKSRCVPILSQTAELLKNYLETMKLTSPDKLSSYVFKNHQNTQLTRAGINYILNKYLKQAKLSGVEMPQNTSPHCLRHTKAMHLMQSQVNLVYIRDFLGHTSVKTTEIYARTDAELKRKAIENAYSPSETTETPFWKQDEDLMEWLSNMCKQ